MILLILNDPTQWNSKFKKTVNNCFNTNIYSYLETSGGQSSYLYLNAIPFLTTMLIGYLWQLKAVVFLHWYFIGVVTGNTKG
jgi:hypothetical protein